jgi:hypothetical protein
MLNPFRDDDGSFFTAADCGKKTVPGFEKWC